MTETALYTTPSDYIIT